MKAMVNEITEKVYRISVEVPPHMIGVPGGFTFNQYLIDDEQPLLFHTGPKPFFPLVRREIEKIIPLTRLKYIGFSHNEADECGALSEFLQEAPDAVPLCSQINAMINGSNMEREPKVLKDGETLSLGKKTIRWLDTPHLPHGWECGYIFEETSRTLFCGDIFTQPGIGMEPVTEKDILGPSEAMRSGMDYFAHSSNTQELLNKLASTNPSILACMHGSAWKGNGAKLLMELSKLLMN